MPSNTDLYHALVEKELGQTLSAQGRYDVDQIVNDNKEITPREIADLIRQDSKRRKLAIFIALGAVILAILGVPAGMNFYQDNYSTTAEVLKAAKNERDPLKARQIILEAKDESCYGSWRLDWCYPEEWRAAASAYFKKAIVVGNSKAFRELYDPEDWSSQDLKTKMRSTVLNRAKTSNDPDLLVAAAQIYRDDRIGVIDTQLETQYRYRAWRAGDKASARRLAEIYLDREQYEEAYLWSLRCIHECERSDAISLTSLSQKVAPGERAKIQGLAKENE